MKITIQTILIAILIYLIFAFLSWDINWLLNNINNGHMFRLAYLVCVCVAAGILMENENDKQRLTRQDKEYE